MQMQGAQHRKGHENYSLSVFLSLFYPIKRAILLIYLGLGFSYWDPERALYHLSLFPSLSHLTTIPGAKQCLIWMFLKLFAVFVGNKLWQEKIIWRATKCKFRWYYHLHHYISKADVPVRTRSVVHNMHGQIQRNNTYSGDFPPKNPGALGKATRMGSVIRCLYKSFS